MLVTGFTSWAEWKLLASEGLGRKENVWGLKVWS